MIVGQVEFYFIVSQKAVVAAIISDIVVEIKI